MWEPEGMEVDKRKGKRRGIKAKGRMGRVKTDWAKGKAVEG